VLPRQAHGGEFADFIVLPRICGDRYHRLSHSAQSHGEKGKVGGRKGGRGERERERERGDVEE